MSRPPIVFVIEDDASVLRSLARLLDASGFAVVPCASAEEFLALPEPDGPACIVTDIRMPGMTGFDLLEVLRGAGRHLPIILTSGDIDAAMALDVRSADVVRFLTKPFASDDLLGALVEAFRSQSAPATPPRSDR